jgi:TolB-like protein/DNA-binding winged helix-turn-helix (wHTH) protein/Flp pilus assembly protein TadD
MERQARQLYEFGPFQLDVEERLLRRDQSPIPLTPKAFETLLVLVENSGHLLAKEELMERVWPGSYVEEANLAQQIFTLRKALGDNNGSQYIETVPKRGYRFVAPVRGVAAMPVQEALSPQATLRWVGIAVLALTAAGMAIAYFARGSGERPAGAAARKVTLAVLPFENLSADSGQEYFADGLTEEMISQLSQLHPEGLAVIARTSAMKYKGTRKGVAEIGDELGADYILEGSVRREGNRVRITSQLVRVSDQTHLWAETHEREVREVLALQGEVARATAGRIGIELTGERQGSPVRATSISPEAYEDYLKGRFFWNKMTLDGYQRSIQHFEAAIRRHPDYAEAHAGLADSFANLGLWGLPGREALSRAREAAEKAVFLRETLADGHASRAFIAMSYEWDGEMAEREFQRALELNPSYAIARHRYGYLLMLRGRWEEAESELRKAQELDPLSMIINANIGFRLYLMRQYDAAIAHWSKGQEMDPDFPLLHGYKGMAYVMKRMYPEALASFEQAKDTPGVTAALGYVYGAMGKKQEARKQLIALLELRRKTFVPAFYVALLYTGMGDKERAFEWLERAYEERSGYLMEIHVDPMFDPLRVDPRFQTFVRRLGLEVPPPSTLE